MFVQNSQLNFKINISGISGLFVELGKSEKGVDKGSTISCYLLTGEFDPLSDLGFLESVGSEKFGLVGLS